MCSLVPEFVFSSAIHSATNGHGASAAFTSDCAPHWGPKEFLDWQGYDLLWKGIFDYLTQK